MFNKRIIDNRRFYEILSSINIQNNAKNGGIKKKCASSIADERQRNAHDRNKSNTHEDVPASWNRK